MAVSRMRRKAFAESLIRVSRIGMISGKPKIAIRVELLSALDEMAETKVKVMEKPVAPRNIIPKN